MYNYQLKNFPKIKLLMFFIPFILMGMGNRITAQILINDNSPITQNFNNMGVTLNLPSNWRTANSATPTWSGGAITVDRQDSTGSPTTGASYNWGQGSTGNRSVGAMTSGGFSSPNSIMAFYRNNGGDIITNLSVTYTAKRFRRNTAAASIQFYYSANGSTWTAVTAGDIAASSLPTGSNTYSFNPPQLELSPLTFNISGLNIANGADVYLRWNLNTTGSNSQGISVDDISVTATFQSGCAAPTTQATNVIFSNNTGNSIQINWTNGNGTGRKVFMTAASAGTPTVTDGIDYMANPNYGVGDTDGSFGWYCVYSGPLNNATVAGLAPGITYRVMVIEYNNCSGTLTYNSNTATNNPANVTMITGNPEPTNHATLFACGTSADVSIPLTWVDATGGQLPSGYLIKWNDIGYGAIFDPVDFTPELDGTGRINVAYGIQNVNITGLNPNTVYYFKIFPYSNSGPLIDYKINGSVPQTSCNTLSTPPNCATEDFTNIPPSSGGYATRTWTGTDGVTWTATTARTDQTIDGSRAICFGNAPDNRVLTSSAYINGMGRLRFTYVRAFTSNTSRTLQIWINGSQVGSDVIVSPTSDVPVTFDSLINITGNIVLEIRSTGTSQVKIDNVSWTCISCNFTALESSNDTRSQTMDGVNQVDFNDNCLLYASVFPNGANPVSGKVDASVTFDGSVQTHQNQPYLQRHFQITPANNPSTATAHITLYFTQPEFDAFNTYITANSLDYPLLPAGPSDPNIANVAVTQFHNNVLDDNKEVLPSRTVSWNATKSWWQVGFDVSGFSTFYLHSDNSHPLAIYLSDVYATNKGNINLVNWTVQSEALGDKYELQRSMDGKSFSYVASFSATGRAKDYEYKDVNPYTGINYYRLKLINNDGSVHYSKIVNARLNAARDFAVEVAPNPFRQSFVMNIISSDISQVTAVIMDMNGRQVYSLKPVMGPQTVNIPDLTAGVYYLRIIDGQNTNVIKLVKN